MQFTLRQEFPYPLETVITAREHRYDYIDNQPSLKSQELLGVERTGAIVTTRRRFKFGDGLPDIVKKMVPAGMLEMIDTNTFNTETFESAFTMRSEYMPDKVTIAATCPYTEINKNATAREYRVEVTVNVPLIGNTVAKAIAQSYKEGLIKDHEILLTACKKLTPK